MKIVCDNCTTKYQIATRRSVARRFKSGAEVRPCDCRQQEPRRASTQQPQPDAAGPRESAPPAAESAPPSDAVWHLVIDREQVGPMTAEEVKAKDKASQVDAETYGWKEGFGTGSSYRPSTTSRTIRCSGSDDQATRRAVPSPSMTCEPRRQAGVAGRRPVCGRPRASPAAACLLLRRRRRYGRQRPPRVAGRCPLCRSADEQRPGERRAERGKGMKGARSEKLRAVLA